MCSVSRVDCHVLCNACHVLNISSRALLRIISLRCILPVLVIWILFQFFVTFLFIVVFSYKKIFSPIKILKFVF